MIENIENHFLMTNCDSYKTAQPKNRVPQNDLGGTLFKVCIFLRKEYERQKIRYLTSRLIAYLSTYIYIKPLFFKYFLYSVYFRVTWNL